MNKKWVIGICMMVILLALEVSAFTGCEPQTDVCTSSCSNLIKSPPPIVPSGPGLINWYYIPLTSPYYWQVDRYNYYVATPPITKKNYCYSATSNAYYDMLTYSISIDYVVYDYVIIAGDGACDERAVIMCPSGNFLNRQVLGSDCIVLDGTSVGSPLGYCNPSTSFSKPINPNLFFDFSHPYFLPACACSGTSCNPLINGQKCDGCNYVAAPVEVCGDGIDNDCDGLVDYSDSDCPCDYVFRVYRDADEDSYGNPLNSREICVVLP